MLNLTSPDGIDFEDVLRIFRSATSEAGKHLNNPLLGTLMKQAPADIIAVRATRFNDLNYWNIPIWSFPAAVSSSTTLIKTR